MKSSEYLATIFSTLEASIRLGLPRYSVKKKAVSVFSALYRLLRMFRYSSKYGLAKAATLTESLFPPFLVTSMTIILRLMSFRSRLTASDRRTPEASSKAMMAKSRSLFLLKEDRARLESFLGYSVSIYWRNSSVSSPKKSFCLIFSARAARVSFFFLVATFFITFR